MSTHKNSGILESNLEFILTPASRLSFVWTKCGRLFTICILVLLFQLVKFNSLAQYTKLLDFGAAPNGRYPNGSLISDGTFLYGMTKQGGTNDLGTIFKIMPDGTGYSKLFDFGIATNGRYPNGSLISDGTFLYGMTSLGGTNDLGTIFKIKPDGNGFIKLLDFDGSANGSSPQGSLMSNGTFLYGMTSSGGTNDLGTIFKIMPDGTGYVKLLDFAGAADGRSPQGSLISDGTFLYGMTQLGGTNDLGTVFKIMPDGAGYVKLLDFTGPTNGSSPYGDLITDGAFLYGMTKLGGTNNLGTIFKIMPNATGYTKLLDFDGANGSQPFGSLISIGTFLYGMTSSGGTSDFGAIFKIMPDGAGYTKVLDFQFGSTETSFPIGSLIYDGTFLRGMTQYDFISGYGTIFKVMPDGTGYTKLWSFIASANSPTGSLTSDGTFMYGMTTSGGTNDRGTVFKIMPDGTGYNTLLDFDGANGHDIYGSLLFDGTFLYGMTLLGGASDRGTVFKIMPDGTGYTRLLDFNFTNGYGPQGSLISDGTFLYGMTSIGGSNNQGVIFKIMPDGTGYAKLLDFNGANGDQPRGSLIFDGTFLYGMTSIGGSNNLGTIFKIMPDGTGYSKLLDFAGAANGRNPGGSLISDGTFLYGMTQGGGISNLGTVFKIMPNGAGYAKLLDFTGPSNGSNPGGDLFSDGMFLYGMTFYGGLNSSGNIFRIMPNGTGYAQVLNFNYGAVDASNPRGSLISDGTSLYGMTQLGGTYGTGTVFKFLPPPPPPNISNFAPASGPVGTTVTITGTNFTGVTAVTFGGTAATSFIVVSSTTVTAVVGVGASGNVAVTTPGGTATSPGFTFFPAPTISSFTPTSAGSGATVTITGANFTGSTAVSFGGTAAASFTVVAATSITAVVAAGTSGNVSVTTPNGTGTRTGFVFISGSTAPTITTFVPVSGPIGTTVTINGTNFSATPANNIVFFGATKATVTAATSTQLTVTVPTGATYQPISVLRNGLTAYSKSPFVTTFAGGGTIDVCSLAPKVDFLTGTTPLSTYIGDLDGDGKADIVTGNQNANTISVYRNTSSTGVVDVTSFAARVDFAVGIQPYIVVIGDVDGDGKPELATANETSGTISVLRNTSAPGTINASSFAAAVNFTVGSAPHSVALADLDADGKPELVAANAISATLSVLKNTSVTGTITAGSFAAKVDFGTGTSPQSVVIADLDGDGKPDLAVTNGTIGTNTLSVFRNTTTIGLIDATSFAAKVDFTTGLFPRSMTIGDIDGDGKPDLATANYSSNTISVLRNTSTSGSITTSSFAAKVDFATASGPHCVTIGDIDGDGKPELAVANGGSASIALFKNISSTGSITTGSFATRIDFATTLGPVNLAIGDLEGDEKPDVVVGVGGSNFVSVFRNTVGSTPPPSITSFAPGAGAIGSTVTITGTNFDLIPTNNIVKFNGTTAVVTASTATSITTTVPAGGTTGTISVTVGCVTATSSTSFTVANASVPTITLFAPTSGPIGTTVTITGTNFDSTPANNIVYFGATRATATAATTTQLTATVPTGATYQPISVLVAGLTAYSISPFVVTFTGGGTIDACSFAPNVSFTTGTSARDVAFGDLDGDGKSDLVVTNNNSNSVSVFLNTSSSGSITSGSFAVKIDFATGAFPTGVAIGDLDGDSKEDLAITNFISNSVSIFRNTSSLGSITSGSFATRVDFTTGTSPNEVAISDVDGDGKLDLAVANYGNNTVSVFLNTSSSGSITTGSFAAKVDFTVGTSARDVAFGDLDGDGKPDLVAANRLSNSLSVLRNTSVPGTITSGSFAAKVDFTTGTEPVELAIGDLDIDGKQDLAATNFSSNSISVFRNLSSVGSISFGAKVDFTTGTNPHDIQISDLDGDGKADLAVSNRSSSNLSAFRNTSTPGSITSGSFAAKVDFTTGTLPTGLAIGDLDGDNKSDLVATNHGSNVMWVLRNTIGESPIPTITSFTPSSGPIGTSITTTGTNFDLIPTNNIVKFNGTTAVVTASTATSITTSVPVGTIAGTITVKVGCNTATSSANFTVTPPLTITSFSPISGPIGTTVTINGTNFSATPANNIVFFGATKATVTAATSTQLTVTVLTGATYQPISVLVAGLTAYSSSPFVVTFPGGGTIDVCSLAPRVDFTAGPILSTYIGDLDGDGKADIVTVNPGPNSISVYRNTSSTGVIDAASFAAQVVFAVGTQPYLVVVGDIDGDGKPDLVTANEVGGNISVLRNTSVSGTIDASSFAAAVNFTAGLGPHSVALADLDADGKPELVAANFSSNTLSVFKNTSVVGSITTGSFAAKVDFGTGTTPQSVAIADLDGDGKPDLAVTNGSGGTNTVSVFRNTTTIGLIDATSFASKVDFTTGFFPRSMAIGDLDADGKPDLAVANYSSNTISVLRNTSTSGSITTSSFAAKVDFATASGPHCVTFGDIDGDGKSDLAVAHLGSPSIGLFKNISSPGSITVSSFTPRTDFATGSVNVNIAIGDLEGDGKPEVVVAVGAIGLVSVFRNTVGSTPVAPVSMNGSACGANNVAVSVSGGVNGQYRWYTVATGGTAIGGEVNNTYTTPLISSTTTYYASINNGTCEGPRTAVVATINTLPTAPTTTGVSNCGPGMLTVTASGGTNGQYRWYTVASGGTAITGEVNSTYLTPLLASSTIYHVAINDATCESTRMPVTALINPVPSAPTITNGISCGPSATVTLNAAGGVNGQYRWYTVASGGTAIPGEVNSLYLTPSLSSTTSYYVAINDLTCESARTPVVATIDNIAPPLAPNVPNCGSGAVNLTASGGTNGQYRWYTVASGGTAIGGEANSIYVTPVLSTTTTYYVSINDGTCESTRAAAVAQINTVPLPPTPIDGNSCGPLSTVTLNATGALSGQYRWYTVASGGAPIGGALNSMYATPAISTNTTYYVSIHDGTCESTRANVLATILIPPAAPGLIGNPPVCAGNSVTLTASGGSASEYRWYNVPSAGTAIAGEQNSTYLTPVLSSSSNYYVAVNDGTCESSRTLAPAVINAIPPSPITTASSACGPSSSLTLKASGGVNGQYRWYSQSSGGSALAGEVNSTFTTPTLTSNTTYYVSINNGQCEGSRSPVVATIKNCNNPPVISSTTLVTEIHGQVMVNLSTLITDADDNLDFSTLQVSGPLQSMATISIDAQYNLTIDYKNLSFAGLDELTVSIKDLLGLSGSGKIYVDVKGDIVINNGISPNGDVRNDAWIIQYIDKLDDTKKNHVSLFNRWGDVVYETDNYDNVNHVFNGIGKNGSEVTTGTYFYKIEFSSGKKTKTGYLSLKR